MTRTPDIAVVAGLALAVSGATAVAQETPYRSGRAVIEIADGGVTTIERAVAVDVGDRLGEARAVGPEGAAWGVRFERSYDPESGVFSRASTATGPQGRSRTVETERRRLDDGWVERTRRVTGPTGASRTRTSTRGTRFH